jgi:ribosome-associated translation inhibitor RaiA
MRPRRDAGGGVNAVAREVVAMARSTDQVRESAVPIGVQVTADPTPHLAEYAERRVREVFRYAHGPVLHARVRVARHPDPALDRPVIAQANLDVDGRWVRAQIAAASAQEAVDLLHDRLRHRLLHVQQRVAGQWEDRRGRRPSDQPHEWRHDSEPTHRPPWFFLDGERGRGAVLYNRYDGHYGLINPAE